MVYPSHNVGCFTRLFPDLPNLSVSGKSKKDVEQKLTDLAGTMLDDEKPVTAEEKSVLPLSGYTYFGQFIDHDLSHDRTPFAEAGEKLVEETRNFRAPRFDLDALYGAGPLGWRKLYNPDYPLANQRFRVGKTVGFQYRDLFREGPQGIALVGDIRNDENLLTAQLTAAFAKLHNAALVEVEHVQLPGQAGQKDTPFAQARRLVTWHYQWLVLNDFLPRIVTREALEQVIRDGPTLLKPDPDTIAVPIEFSLAAFRFGHSMVRNDYRISPDQDGVTLDELMTMTGYGGGLAKTNGKLPDEWIVEWARFFRPEEPAQQRVQLKMRGTKAQRRSTEVRNVARKFDTAVAKGLHYLKPNPLYPNDPTNLPELTLRRGWHVGLPSGQRVAEKLGIDRVPPDVIAQGPAQQILTDTDYNFHEQTPLWYYILKEAEVSPVKFDGLSQPLLGCRLGPLGSRLVAETIYSLLLADPDSYLNVAPDWQPTLRTEPGDFMMSDLLRFAGVY